MNPLNVFSLIVSSFDPGFDPVAIFTPLTIFGLIAVIAMVVCYACENRSPAFILAFAGACVLGSIYGFLQGAWPFGAVELVWSAIAISRWRKARHEKALKTE
ncbi:MAG: hypothetical protein WAN60_17060 [Candidatus Sulfotelmatobacter sp.]